MYGTDIRERERKDITNKTYNLTEAQARLTKIHARTHSATGLTKRNTVVKKREILFSYNS